MRTTWVAVVFTIPAELEEEVAAALGADSLGVESRDVAPGRCELRIYSASHALAEAIAARAAGDRTLFGSGRPSEARIEPVDDGRWAERYQASLAPFALGGGFAVQPTAEHAAAADHSLPAELQGRWRIHLVPGRAFGTGEHATTRLCVEALETHVRPGERWLDLGTGSGILAVVARRLGAVVVARDVDPESVEVARRTLAANALLDEVVVEIGSTDGLAPASFHGVVANIAAPFFVEDPGRALDLLAPGGLLLASGILQSETDEVVAALAGVGAVRVETRQHGEWVLLAARRPGAT